MFGRPVLTRLELGCFRFVPTRFPTGSRGIPPWDVPREPTLLYDISRDTVHDPNRSLGIPLENPRGSLARLGKIETVFFSSCPREISHDPENMRDFLGTCHGNPCYLRYLSGYRTQSQSHHWDAVACHGVLRKSPREFPRGPTGCQSHHKTGLYLSKVYRFR